MSLRVFISYRRADSDGQYLAHMIFRALKSRYGPASVFLDVDSKRPGLSFPDKVRDALDKCNAVFVIIGPQWLMNLKQREKDERDWVRYEISESLKRPYLPVVPICHPDAEFPTAIQLPKELQGLASKDGTSLDPFREFDSQLARLLEDLEAVIRDQEISSLDSIEDVRNTRVDSNRPEQKSSAVLANEAVINTSTRLPIGGRNALAWLGPAATGLAVIFAGLFFIPSPHTETKPSGYSAAITASSPSPNPERIASDAQPVTRSPEINSKVFIGKTMPPLNEDT